MLYADPCIHRISNALCCIKQSGCAQPGANSSSCKTHQIARSQKHVHDLRQFRYDASKEVRENVSLTSTGTSSYFAGNTWYLNGEDSLGLTYEKEVRANGTTENKHYLMAGGQVFAVFTSRTGTLNGLAASTTSYFQHDQLGSIAVVTDENGVVKERLAYDPWGKRRNIMSSPGTPDTRDLLVGKYTNRGFTEHEHLDEIGMIHMNGRIYDPLIGRFMSADSLIEAPDQLASYNRYSYVWNNPLNRVDPSGFCWICNPIGETFKTLNHIGDVIASDPVARTLVTVAIAYYTGQWATNSLGFSAIGSGALGGAASSAFASNGDINAIAVGAVTGAGFGWAGGVGGADSFARYAAHASVGCVSAVASGGSCGAGAASAVFGKYTTNAIGDIGGSGISAVIARGVATAVAGGVGAVIAGGSFENGAWTAAFGYLFNQVMHQLENNRMVFSVANGVVSEIGWQDPKNHGNGFGFRMRIATIDGQQSWIYAHLEPDSIQVYQSQVVLQGDYIGDYASPANGNSSGPHLHLELRNKSNTPVLNQGNVNPIPGGHMTSDIQINRVLTTNNGTQARPHNGTDWVGGR